MFLKVTHLGSDDMGSDAGMAGLVEKSQQERIQRERLVAVGQMMRRLAHNIRNPLPGIRGLAELTRQETPDQPLR